MYYRDPNGPPPQKLPAVITKGEYIFSQAVWIANVICPIAVLLIGNPHAWAAEKSSSIGYLFALFFVLVLVLRSFSNVLTIGKYELVPQNLLTRLDYLMLGTRFLSTILVFGILALLWFIGGNPDIVDGVYCAVSHGSVVREIPEGLFCFMSYCYRWLFAGGGMLVFTTILAIHTRALYVKRLAKKASQQQ